MSFLRSWTWTNPSASIEPMSPDWRDDPYSVYQQLREKDPVHWAPEAKAFCISSAVTES